MNSLKYQRSHFSKFGSGQLDIHIDFKPGWKFNDPGSNSLCPVHDTVERTWRHVNFFQHDCYVHARVARIRLPDGSVRQVGVLWAMEGSSFTLLFEAMSMLLVKEGMSLSGAGRMVDQDSRVIGRIIERYVDQAKKEQMLEQVEVLGIDEVSIQKGHQYLSILSDSKRKKVVGVGLGKGKEAVLEGLEEMESRGSKAEGVKYATTDFSPSYISAVLEYIPNAIQIYDRFHLEQLLSKAVDTVRKQEQSEATELKKTKYLWLRNEQTLTPKQQAKIYYLSICFPKIGEAYRLKELFKQIFDYADQLGSIQDLKEWMKIAATSKLVTIQQFLNALRSHWSGITNYFRKHFTNAYAEQLNSTIQLIKRVARGYRNIDNYITMIYFKLGGLNFHTH
ncbi:MAG: ISL3 family transposase [Saprospiraceae bacterium]|nr:ISL3 family transposase [Saprospiraceae bacterium]